MNQFQPILGTNTRSSYTVPDSLTQSPLISLPSASRVPSTLATPSSTRTPSIKSPLSHLEAAATVYHTITQQNIFQEENDEKKTTETILHPHTTEAPLSSAEQQRATQAISQHREDLYRNRTPFEEWLAEKQFCSTKVSGEGLNCLIHALLQHATGQYLTERFEEAENIRNRLDQEFPNHLAMLQDDDERTKRLLELVNEKYQSSLRICFIQVNNKGQPGITSCIGSDQNHPVVIWNQAMHYVAITTQTFYESLTLSQVSQKILKPAQKKPKPIPTLKKEPPSQKKSLKPLKQNPLNKTNPQGFSVAIPRSHPSYRRYPTWYEAVGLRVPLVRETPEYQRTLTAYKNKIAACFIQPNFTSSEQHCLDIILQTVDTILKTDDREKINVAIGTIHENAYHLIVYPLKQTVNYIEFSSNIFMAHQSAFREELGKIFTKSSTHQSILNHIIDGLASDQILTTQDEQLQLHPQEKEVILQASTKAQILLKEARDKAQQEINRYIHIADIQFCLKIIVQRDNLLLLRFACLLRGLYASPEEMTSGFSSQPLCASCIPTVAELLKNLQRPNSLENIKKSCEDYVKRQHPIKHFEKNVKPLLVFLQVIKNVLAWPQEYELCPKELDYLHVNLYWLMGISYRNLTKEPYIPDAYLTITEEEKKTAKKILEKRDLLPSEKRRACRLLFHAAIPWKKLQALGCLFHAGGDIREKERAYNQELVRPLFVDLVADLSKVKEAIEQLIDFEMAEFSSTPSLAPPKELSQKDYPSIHFLGNISDIQRGAKKIQEVLNFWINLPLTPADWDTPKTTYALLRTIQILGESAKNLHKTGVLSSDPFWDQLGELRDAISHPERISVYKRLQEGMARPNLRSAILENFRTLAEYFQKRVTALHKSHWADCRKPQTEKEHITYLDMKGLQDLYLFLLEKISSDQQTTLINSLQTDEARQNRNKIFQIKAAFLASNFAEYEPSIAHLPLTKSRQKELEDSIKPLVKPSIAANHSRNAKPGMLGKLVKIILDLKKNKELVFVNTNLTAFQEIIAPQGSFSNPEKPTQTECTALLQATDFHARIRQAKTELDLIKDTFCKKNKKNPTLQILEDLLNEIVEDVNSFCARKKKELEDLVLNIPTYETFPEIEEEGKELIRSIQLQPISIEELRLKIKELGIFNSLHIQRWEEAYTICIKKTTQPLSAAPEQTKSFIEFSREKALNCINTILDRIEKLQSLNPSNPYAKDDNLLELACQYLVSDFRSAGGSLESCLEPFKQRSPEYRVFFKDTQAQLLLFLKQSNDLLHLHEVVEPVSLTSTGQRWKLFAYLNALLDSSSKARPSLHQRLLDLKNILTE